MFVIVMFLVWVSSLGIREGGCPGVFSSARTLLLGTPSVNTLGKHTKNVRSHERPRANKTRDSRATTTQQKHETTKGRHRGKEDPANKEQSNI